MNTRYYSKLHPYWRALLPSSTSLIGGLFASVFIVGFHLLVLTLNSAERLPSFLGDLSLEAVGQSVVTELQSFFNSPLLNQFLGGLLWGGIGFVLFILFENTARGIREWYIAEHNIQLPSKQHVIKHPGRGSLLFRIVWRIAIVGVVVAVTRVSLPSIRSLLAQDDLALASPNVGQALVRVAVSLLFWTVLMQVYIVLLRLFALRTRLLGEILY